MIWAVDNDPAATGPMIRQLRELRGLALEELAQLAGIDESDLTDAENARLGLDADKLSAVADALKVSELSLVDSSGLFGRMALSGGEQPDQPPVPDL